MGYNLDRKNPNKKEEERQFNSKEGIKILDENINKSNETLNKIKNGLF